MSWCADDPELLNAAQFLLASSDDERHDDDLDAAADALTVGARPYTVEEPVESRQSTPLYGPFRTTNHARERQRREVALLRDTADELDVQLGALKRRRADMLKPLVGHDGAVKSVALVWEDVAMRQLRKRQKAELLNAKLRAMLDTQVRIAQDLVKAVQKTRSFQQIDTELLPSSKRVRAPIDVSQKVSEEDMLVRLDELCQDSQSAFSLSAYSSLELRSQEVRVIKETDGETIFDVQATWAVPFPLDRVEQAMWIFFLEETVEVDGHAFHQDYESTEDTIIAVFSAHCNTKTVQGEFNGKSVAKRYRDADGRFVMVAYMYSEPHGFALSALEGVGVHDDMWFRLRSTSIDAETPQTAPVTQVQVRRRLRVVHAGENPGRDEQSLHSLTAVLMDYVKRDLWLVQQSLDDVLLRAPT